MGYAVAPHRDPPDREVSTIPPERGSLLSRVKLPPDSLMYRLMPATSAGSAGASHSRSNSPLPAPAPQATPVGAGGGVESVGVASAVVVVSAFGVVVADVDEVVAAVVGVAVVVGFEEVGVAVAVVTVSSVVVVVASDVVDVGAVVSLLVPEHEAANINSEVAAAMSCERRPFMLSNVHPAVDGSRVRRRACVDRVALLSVGRIGLGFGDVRGLGVGRRCLCFGGFGGGLDIDALAR